MARIDFTWFSYCQNTFTQFFFTVTRPLRKVSDLEEAVAAASGVFREEPPYRTAEELWEGLKPGDEGAGLCFCFFLRLCKNEKNVLQGKRWVGFRIEDARHFYLSGRHRAVPYQKKPKSVVAIEPSRAQRDIFARSGLARYTAPSVEERAAVELQTTLNKIYQQWPLLWMDKWYNKRFHKTLATR